MRESEKSAPRAQSPSRPFPRRRWRQFRCCSTPARPASRWSSRASGVYLGQKIGAPDGFVSAAVHASVSGKVKGIQPRIIAGGRRVAAVILENDGLDEWDPSLAPLPEDAGAEKLLEAVREAGIVGLGGATFPTHVKLSPPKDKPIDTVILNGAECEPFLSADHRVMLEEADAVLDGLRLAARIVGAQTLLIGVEDNKPDAADEPANRPRGRTRAF